MTVNLAELYEKYSDNEYLEFERVTEKLSNRPDIHAFILLDKLCPSDHKMISASEHDEFFLSPDCDELAKIITEEQFIELIRCGVRYDEYSDSLCMFS